MSTYDSISQHLIGSNSYDGVQANSETDGQTIDEINFEDLLADSYIKLSGYSNKELRSIKLEIEELILNKIKVLEEIEKNSYVKKRERSVYYSKDFSIDRIGNQVILGQTGISEGWTIPIYRNEYPDLLGLPFTEDHALTSSLRIKKPKQECFNCLSTDHRVTECPVKINNERIAMHRSEFNSQSMQSQDQMSLFSTRYTSDPDAKLYRGFTPGKLSDQLREALGCKPNQLPPFVYFMREYGYPEGWLIEAQVSSNKLSVHNGDGKQAKDMIAEDDLVDGEVKSPSKDPSLVEYDQNKIYSFVGFNEPIPNELIDESDKFRVKRFSEALSREVFLATLNLSKKKVVQRRSVYRNDSQSDDREEDEIKAENEEDVETEEIEEENDLLSESMSSPSARNGTRGELGLSFNEIPGTPIVENVKDVKMVPDWEKFSQNICEHKMYEMSVGTPTGSYQKIVNLTREFKSAMDEAPKFNNE